MLVVGILRQRLLIGRQSLLLAWFGLPMRVLVLLARRPASCALAMTLFQVPHHLGIRGVGDRRLRQLPQAFLGGGQTRVRLLRAFLLVGADAQPAGQRRQRRTLYYQGDEDDAERDENDLVARRESCPGRRLQRQRQCEDQRVRAAQTRPGDEEYTPPRRQRLLAVTQPAKKDSECVRGRHHPDDANEHDTNAD